MKTLSLLVTLCLAPFAALGTSQIPDTLLIEGVKHDLYTNPLDSYFSEANPSPEFFYSEGTQSSANWRGYIATWEIKDGKLYLAKVDKEYSAPGDDDEYRTEMRLIEADRIIPGASYPIFATWFTGDLRIPEGELIQYVHMGYASVYEKTLIYKIENGIVTENLVIDNTGSNSYRSQPDLEWCAIGNAAFDASGEWLDARLLASSGIVYLFEDGSTFMTRGIYFTTDEEDDAPAFLWIPETPQTRRYQFPIHQLPEGTATARGSHVEITGHFVPNGDNLQLIVTDIRPLRAGQTMHDPAYPTIIQKLNDLSEKYDEEASAIVRESISKPGSTPQ